jgi:hypothetical protein
VRAPHSVSRPFSLTLGLPAACKRPAEVPVKKDPVLPATAAATAATATTAAPAATTTAATRTSTTAAAAVTTATATRRFRPSLIHVQGPSMKLRSVQMGDRCLSLVRIGHFHKRESARLAGAAVGYDIHALYSAVLGEGCVQFVLSCLVAEVPDKNIGHEIIPFWLSGLSLHLLLQHSLSYNPVRRTTNVF